MPIKDSKPTLKVIGLELYVTLRGEYKVNAPLVLMMGWSENALTVCITDRVEINKIAVRTVTAKVLHFIILHYSVYGEMRHITLPLEQPVPLREHNFIYRCEGLFLAASAHKSYKSLWKISEDIQ
jgi:hypothetical protein